MTHDNVGEAFEQAASSPPLRCPVCHKKVKISSVPCRCQLTFCEVHKLPEAHTCAFDYKKHHQELVRARNPKIVAPKIS